jgi:hypothetical protein
MQARHYDPIIGRFLSNDPVEFDIREPALFNRYAYANNNPVEFVDPDGQLTVDAATAAKYPKAAAYLQNKTVKATSKYAAFLANGQATKSTVDAAFTPGKGPTIVGATLSGANGKFKPGIGSTDLEIDETLLDNFEKGLAGSKTLLDSTTEHEATHYFDDLDGVDQLGEEGQQFEIDVYGKDIDTLSDADTYDKAHPSGPP